MNYKTLEFVRDFSWEFGGDKISGTFQPYLSGMYAAISDNKASDIIQLNLKHKEVKKWFNSLVKKLEKRGGKVVISKSLYKDYLSLESLEKYKILD